MKQRKASSGVGTADWCRRARSGSGRNNRCASRPEFSERNIEFFNSEQGLFRRRHGAALVFADIADAQHVWAVGSMVEPLGDVLAHLPVAPETLFSRRRVR
jgi:hypothetical protein